jgi:hypothetical protein
MIWFTMEDMIHIGGRLNWYLTEKNKTHSMFAKEAGSDYQETTSRNIWDIFHTMPRHKVE